MRIQKALIEDTISTKKAGLLLYSMQLALQNVGQVTFGQAKTRSLCGRQWMRREAISSQQSAISQDKTFHETQRNRGQPEEEKSLPRMDADDRGFTGGIRPVEWKPTPDMYRMDTPEGREAYEASFGMKIGPHSRGAEERPLPILCHTSMR